MVALKTISPQDCSNLHSSMLEDSLYFHPSHSHSILTQEAYVSIPYSTKHVKTDDSCTAIKACFYRSQPYADWREASSWWGKTQQCPISEHMFCCHRKHRTKYKYQTMLHHWRWASLGSLLYHCFWDSIPYTNFIIYALTFFPTSVSFIVKESNEVCHREISWQASENFKDKLCVGMKMPNK